MGLGTMQLVESVEPESFISQEAKRSSTGQRIRHHLLGKGSKYNRALRRTEAKEGRCRRLGAVKGKT